ncbi:Esterase EstD [Alphaproteobacteria bacterium SO-S41]|nr:Esterase EstD [Alphaproteobacteria bacterium SO-S41]
MMQFIRAIGLGLLVALTFSEARALDLVSWQEQDVTIGKGDDALHGTFLAPDAMDSYVAVLFLSGSGPTDRNGNQPGMENNSLKMLAEALGYAGIASIRVDKRGVAASAKAGPKEEDLRFETYIDDAKAWLAFLKAQPLVRQVWVLGHSEGALIGSIVAQSKDVAGFISLAGAGEKAADVLRRQLAENPLALAMAEPTLKKLEAGELDPDANPALGALFRPSVQPYLISWFKYDPAAEIAKVPGKVAIIQGSHDIQVLVLDAEKLHAARPDAAYTLIEGMNHILKIAPADRAGNVATYNDPTLHLAGGLSEAVALAIFTP